MRPLSPLGEAALEYAAIGWPVFPCRPNGKEPIGAACPNGVKNATLDPRRIRYWWTRWPDANIAVACGAPGPDVLDVDTKDGRAGLALFRQAWRAGHLRGATATIRTPSGGLHFWYAGTGQRGGAVGRDKALELKAVGGYVLLPPSRVVSVDYGYDGIYEVIEQAATEQVIDWTAVKQLLDPPPVPTRTIHQPRALGGGLSPGADFNQRGDWPGVLLPHDWTFAGLRGAIGYWRRPGKKDGISATTNARGTDRLHIFTSSTAFDQTSYHKFAAYTLLNFGGLTAADFANATRELRTLGYGSAALANQAAA